MKPKIITLCGSSRFVAAMAIISWVFERDGNIICLGLHYLPPEYPMLMSDHMAEHEGFKEHFDELHKRKIDISDEIFVVNIDGYIGESTKSEIEYAKEKGKIIKYLND